MDKRAKIELLETLSSAGVKIFLLGETAESIIDIFDSYRRRMASSRRERLEIYSDLCWGQEIS